MLNSILMVPGPPERLNKLKNRFFEKSENFQKITKKYKNGSQAPGGMMMMMMMTMMMVMRPPASPAPLVVFRVLFRVC